MTRSDLETIRGKDRSINEKRMELDALRYKASGAGGLDYSREHVQTSPGDYMTMAMNDIVELSRQIKEDEEELEILKGQAYIFVKRMENVEHRTFIEWYYLNGLSMIETAAKMNMSERNIYYIRDSALEMFESL